MTEFDGVFPALSQALNKRGYTELTSVQKAVIAPDLGTVDLLVSAQTGSGKTVAFGLNLAPTLLDGAEKFTKTKKPLALVIAPTRELALQVARELEWLYAESGASVSSCVGGMDMRTERRALQRGPHIVVGTPGRLRDHIERGYFDTSGLKAVVLDEADEMLDLGFRDELEYILDTAPEERRTLMFSATVPKSIASLAKRYQNNAQRITTKGEAKQHIDIDYHALIIAPNDRENAIINILRFHEAKNTIIFCGTRAAVNLLTSRLTNRGLSVVALSGELSQSQRSHALQALRDGRAQVCVATDVAARGIDLPDLELVIHADLPKNRDLLLHRSGRTGRAGRKGISALIVPHNWRSRTERLLKNASITATWGKPPSIPEITQRDRERFLADPVLNEPVQEDEKEFIQELLTQFGPEQIAAALIRINSAQKPAPEELLDTTPAEGPKKRLENFKDGVWVSLSVGRKHSAEPRWLLPALCSAGHLTKRQIGSIRILKTETHVELSPECAESFFSHLGPTGKMEKNITVTRLDGVPEEPEDTFDHSRKRSRNRSNKKTYSGSDRGKRPFKKKYDKNSSRDEGQNDDRKPKKKFKNKHSDRANEAYKDFEQSNNSGKRKFNTKNKDGSKPSKRKKFKNKDNG